MFGAWNLLFRGLFLLDGCQTSDSSLTAEETAVTVAGHCWVLRRRSRFSEPSTFSLDPRSPIEV